MLHLGHKADWRESKDTVRNAIILVDPSQTVSESAVVVGCHMYTLTNRNLNRVYLQIWRPDDKVTGRRRMYKLVTQVLFYAHIPGEKEFTFHPSDRMYVESGDIVGIHFPGHNPIPWDIVKCNGGNVHLFKYNPFQLGIGSEYPFETADTSWKPCRQYSLNITLMSEDGKKIWLYSNF